MSDWFGRIEKSLKTNNFESRAWSVGDGRLLVTPFAARLLACELPGVEGNLFWHNPAVEDAAKTKEVMQGAGGTLGGDRMWLGPENGLMWRDLEEARRDPFKAYTLPPQMDPADWRIVEDSTGHLRLTTEITVTDYRVNRKIRLRAGREFNIAGPPPGLPKGVRSASFTIRNDVTTLEADPGAAVGMWDLLQLPSTGDLICPTNTPVGVPRSYYGTFDAKHIQSDPRRVVFHIDGKLQIKMGLSPTQTTGRMGFLRKVGNVTTLIVRIFQPMPGEPYVDLPRSSHEFFGGDALQAYNDDAMFGGFGEMEYHEPALIAGKTPVSRSGANITHVIAGADKAVREVGSVLLGVEV